MSAKWRYALTFVGGVLLGAAGAALFVGWHWNRSFSNWYVLQVGSQANVAREIFLGNELQLAERIKEGLPVFVRAAQREFAEAECTGWALWMVSDVYEAAGTPPSAELQAVFASLPPRQSCELSPSAPFGAGAPR